MDINDLIRKLKDTRRVFPNSDVVIATSSQVLNSQVPGLNSAYRVPIADDSRLGDESGAIEGLFIVAVSREEPINGSE